MSASSEENMVLCAALEFYKARLKIDPDGSAPEDVWDDVENKEEALKEAIDRWAVTLDGVPQAAASSESGAEAEASDGHNDSSAVTPPPYVHAGQWISVKEKMPPSMVPVITTNGQMVRAAYHTGKAGETDSWSAWSRGMVTHWMPYPDAPETISLPRP